MKSLSQITISRFYLIAALFIPCISILVALYILNLPDVSQLKYRTIYDIAVNIAATGITILVTLFLFDKANAIKMTYTISEALRDNTLPLSQEMKRIIREAISNFDPNSNVMVFHNEEDAYKALIDDIDNGDVYIVNTIFVTDNPNGKYHPVSSQRFKWIDSLKQRISESIATNGGKKFTLYLIEAPNGGASEFVEAIGGEKAISNSGGRIFSLDADTIQSQFMANFVLIKKTIDSIKRYIVYLGWFARAPHSTEYPSPAARIESEHLFKFLERSYCHALTSFSSINNE